MYADYFGLAEIPFRITPDPRYLWYSEQHQEAKDKILHHITQSAGPIYLFAEIGTGKTTIARRIVEELSSDKKKNVVFVFAPKLTTTNAFLRFVMDEFGVKTERAYGKSLKNFEEFLLEQYQNGLSPVLLVDEAQNMTRDMLLLIQHIPQVQPRIGNTYRADPGFDHYLFGISRIEYSQYVQATGRISTDTLALIKQLKGMKRH